MRVVGEGGGELNQVRRFSNVFSLFSLFSYLLFICLPSKLPKPAPFYLGPGKGICRLFFGLLTLAPFHNRKKRWVAITTKIQRKTRTFFLFYFTWFHFFLFRLQMALSLSLKNSLLLSFLIFFTCGGGVGMFNVCSLSAKQVAKRAKPMSLFPFFFLSPTKFTQCSTCLSRHASLHYLKRTYIHTYTGRDTRN